jgi:hypothetical protein
MTKGIKRIVVGSKIGIARNITKTESTRIFIRRKRIYFIILRVSSTTKKIRKFSTRQRITISEDKFKCSTLYKRRTIPTLFID